MPRAVICGDLGPQGTAIGEVSAGQLSLGSARLRISSIGVNFVVLLMLEEFKPPLPFGPGLDAAGRRWDRRLRRRCVDDLRVPL